MRAATPTEAASKAPHPAGYSAALDIFPVDPPCFYADTFGAPRAGGRHHEGVDIIAARNKPIYAVRSGRISEKYYSPTLSGNAIAITTPQGDRFYYGHLDHYAPGMAIGVSVKTGEVIGYVGSTGDTVVPHVHFEVHPHGGKAVDPTPYVAEVDRCGYKGPRLPAITTTTVKATTTTTIRRSTTTTTHPTTTTTIGRTTTTTEATTTTTVAGPLTPEPTNAVAYPVLASLVRPGITTRVQVSGIGPLPAGSNAVDLKLVASEAALAATVRLTDCVHPSSIDLAVASRAVATKLVVVAVPSDGRLCLTASKPVKLDVSVRQVWTSDHRRVTLIAPRVLFDSSRLRRRPSLSWTVSVAGVGVIPRSVRWVLVSLAGTATRAATVSFGACGRTPTLVTHVAAGQHLSVDGWVELTGTKVCIVSTTPTAVHLDTVGFA